MLANVITSTNSSFELWYFPLENVFRDIEGDLVYGLQKFFSVPQIEAWKKTRSYACLKAKTGQMIELWYPEKEAVEYAKTHKHLLSNF